MMEIHTSSNADLNYLSCDEFIDVENSLTLVRDALRNVKKSPAYWKSIILFTHSALQGACVCMLTRSDGGGALSKRAERALNNKLYGETDGRRNMYNEAIVHPEPFIADLPALLDRLPGGLRVTLPARNAKCYGWDHAGDLRRLHEFRNMLTHFPSSHWSLEIDGLPRIVSVAVDLIFEIANSSRYANRNRFDVSRLKALKDDIQASLCEY